ncbi:hypothetical protein NXS19_010737 [Fusarium pseudograminearum]|nr:hypothetical protein NXS19_010737 [Fusarium pseudograminearum]
MDALAVAAGVVGISATARAASPKILRILDGLGLFSSLHEDLATTEERFYFVEESFDDAEFDIVVIHDVQNTRPARRPTNAQNDQTVRQLRDKVTETEKVRILAYHYDTTLRSSEFLTRRTLLHEAIQLTTRLVRARANVKHEDRPIIFVAHSLGGILLKNALILSESSKKEDERAILVSTAGCFFFNTPHETSPVELSESIWAIVQPKLSPLQVQSKVWQRQEFLSWATGLVLQTKRFDILATTMFRKPQYIKREILGDKEIGSLDHSMTVELLQMVLCDLRRESRFKSGNTVVPCRESDEIASATYLSLGGRSRASDMNFHIQPSNPLLMERDVSVSPRCFEANKQTYFVAMLGPEGHKRMLHEEAQSSPKLLVPTTFDNSCSLFEIEEPCCSPSKTHMMRTKDIKVWSATREAKEIPQPLSEIPSKNTSFIRELEKRTHRLCYGSSIHNVEYDHCIASWERCRSAANTYNVLEGRFSYPQDISFSVSGCPVINDGRIWADQGSADHNKEFSISSSSLEGTNRSSSFCVPGQKWDTSFETEVPTTMSLDDRTSRQLDTAIVYLSKGTHPSYRCPTKMSQDNHHAGAQVPQKQRTTPRLVKPFFKILEKLGFSRAGDNSSAV